MHLKRSDRVVIMKKTRIMYRYPLYTKAFLMSLYSEFYLKNSTSKTKLAILYRSIFGSKMTHTSERASSRKCR